MFRKTKRNRKGRALVEYALLIAGVALISAAAVSIFGHKTSDMIATVSAILPGTHTDDNGPILSGHLIETTAGSATSPIQLDVNSILSNSGTARLGNNVLGTGPGRQRRSQHAGHRGPVDHRRGKSFCRVSKFRPLARKSGVEGPFPWRLASTLFFRKKLVSRLRTC